MGEIEFKLFDADNHYYEATDAFTRHIDPKIAKRCVQWATIDGRQRLVVGGRVNRFIPNPTFDPVAKPGSLDAYFRGRTASDDIRSAFGELDPILAEYRDRDARLAVMDRQGIEGCFLFPTLGVGMEEALTHDPEAAHAAFHAFNQWLEQDWGFNFRDRLFAAPILTLLDPERAVEEVEWVLSRDVRVVVMRSAPVMMPSGARSPGDRIFDPVWARLAEGGVTVAYHSGDSGYGRYAQDWGEPAEMEAFRRSAFRALTSSDRAIFDTIAALICHGVFARHPNLRVATIESGSDWVQPLIKKMKRIFSQSPASFSGDPIEQLCTGVWVAPYYEDDIRALSDAIGSEHVLFGSDWPHAEGLAEPAAFVKDLVGFSDEEIRRIMRDNAMSLSKLRAVS